MTCARCNRKIKGATFSVGRLNYGPHCAKLMGFELYKTRKIEDVILQDGQMNLFGGADE